jgi:subtilase family protein
MPPDIAVIDSGINPGHSHVRKVAGGHSIVLNSQEHIEEKPEFADEIGHGTAIAGVLRDKAPFVDLYGIKIFQKQLTAPASLLKVALAWAIEKGFKIIHLSLGTQMEEYRDDLHHLCQTAYDKGIVISAAARAPYDEIFPAAFETVIGVFWDPRCSADTISYHPGEKVEFGAHGWPMAIPGMPQEMNFRGHSFAVAHVTGKIAQLAIKYPEAGPAFLKSKLSELSIEGKQQKEKGDRLCGNLEN